VTVDLKTDLTELRRHIEMLTDRTAIEDTFAEYAAAMDGQDPAALFRLFAPDIILEHPKGGANGRDAAVAQISGAMSRHFTSHHMITNIRVTIDGARARAVGYFHSIHLDDPAKADQHDDHGGWYLAELVRTDRGWLIDRLKQVSVWSAGNRQPKEPLDPSIPDELRRHLAGGAD